MTNLGRYTKAIVPAVGSIMAVLYGWANTGRLDYPTLRLAAVGLVYAGVVYLLPNVPIPPLPVAVATAPAVPVIPAAPAAPASVSSVSAEVITPNVASLVSPEAAQPAGFWK